MSEDFPYEITPFSSEEVQNLKNFYKDGKVNYARIGPKGYVVIDGYKKEAANIYNFPLRSDDVFVLSYPKSGTTWTQDLVWLLLNDLDYKKAKSISLDERFPFLEFFAFLNILDIPKDQITPLPDLKTKTVDEIKNITSQRFIKSHLAFSLLPPDLLDKSKVLYVARDPRDVAVSFYHHRKLMRITEPGIEFKVFWNHFINDKLSWSPYFGNVLEAWEKRNHPNMLFIFYEELSEDLPREIRKLADFFNKKLTEEQIEELREHLKFDNFKKNKAVNLQDMQDKGFFHNEGGFIRKGKVGGWREYFDEEMTAQAAKWINENLEGTDFKFPQ